MTQLHLSPDKAAVIDEAHRVLPPVGQIAASDIEGAFASAFIRARKKA